MHQKGFAHILVIFIIFATIAAIGEVLYYEQFSENSGSRQACTMEAKFCPDGSAVGREGPKCEFAQCPGTVPAKPGEGKFCGGIAPGAFPCPEGYVCKLDGAYPDAGGHCVLPDGTGSLTGRVTIGPNCPVERIDNPCVTPPEAYASRQFNIVTKDTGQIVKTFNADMTGNYIISLKPGTYLVTPEKSGIGYTSKDLPATVTIKAGEAATLDIDVDTGIR